MSEKDLKLIKQKLSGEEPLAYEAGIEIMELVARKLGVGIRIREQRAKVTLTPELVTGIKKMYDDLKEEIRRITKSKSEKIVRNYYYAMVYAILRHHNYCIENRNVVISASKFGRLFEVNRRTVKNNQDFLDFYKNKKYTQFDELEGIFGEIEKNITRNEIRLAV